MSDKKKLTDELIAKEAEISHLMKFVEEKSSECKNLKAKCEEYQGEINRLSCLLAESERESMDASSEVQSLKEKIESLLESKRLLSESLEKKQKKTYCAPDNSMVTIHCYCQKKTQTEMRNLLQRRQKYQILKNALRKNL